jgi:hypothetical protein
MLAHIAFGRYYCAYLFVVLLCDGVSKLWYRCGSFMVVFVVRVAATCLFFVACVLLLLCEWLLLVSMLIIVYYTCRLGDVTILWSFHACLLSCVLWVCSGCDPGVL